MDAFTQREYLVDLPGKYHIYIRGMLDASWSDRLGGMTVSRAALSDDTPISLLSGELMDQSALLGVLNTLHDLHVTLMLVERVEADAKK